MREMVWALWSRTRLPSLVAMGFGASQIAAACTYAPPPLPSHGQGADTAGEGAVAAGVEVGLGNTASWWNSSSIADPEVHSELVGGLRLRAGIAADLDLGLVSAVGPERTVLTGPELKWRFAHVRTEELEDGPAFHAAIISGLALGSADFRYPRAEGEPKPRYWFLAPYTGVLASGGIESIQMFSGVRLAASEVLGNDVQDLTLYPVLAFGALVRPARAWTVWAESDLASGVTTEDLSDTAVIVYAAAGVTVTFADVW